MTYLKQVEGDRYIGIERLSPNSIRTPFVFYGLDFGEHRKYKVTISISCSGPQNGKVKPGRLNVLRKREEADLFYTTNDADWLYRWSKDNFDKKKYGSGKREKHIRLVNPTLQELNDAIIVAGQYFKSFSNRSDWCGGEVLLIYAGHGVEGDGDLYISGELFSAKCFLKKLVDNLPQTGKTCRIDLLLDSCYSGAFVGNFLFEIFKNYGDKLLPFDLFGSCLHDETSLECSAWNHGILTYSLQHNLEVNLFDASKESCLLSWQAAVQKSLFQGGVIYLSNGDQHAFNIRNGNLKVFGSVVISNIFEELGGTRISIKDIYNLMDVQRKNISLIDFNKPYTKELYIEI